MNTVIIISNDPRIALAKEVIQPLLMAKISIVPDFDTGLKEVFEKRPLVVFIQDEIAGVKGETVTRHIKSLLQANSPEFIRLSRTNALTPGRAAESGEGLNLNLPGDELVAAFREQLQQVSGIRWKEQVPLPAEPLTSPRPLHTTSLHDEDFFGTAPQVPANEELFSFFPANEDDAPHSPMVQRFADDNAEESAQAPQPAVPQSAGTIPPPEPVNTMPEWSRVPETEPPPTSRALRVEPQIIPQPAPPASRPEKIPEPPPEPAPEPPPVLRRDPGIDSWMAGDPADELPFPAESVTPPGRRWVPLVVVGGIVAAIACGGALYRYYPANPKSQDSPAVVKQPLPAPAPAPKPAPTDETRRGKLPSFIPKEGFDPTYGTARPGWERYLSPRREYLVFREQGRIKALQVIALQKEAITATFVASVLSELCGDATCKIRSRSSRNGYMIEQGETPSKAEVLFYKKKGAGEIRGVVISLP